MKRDLFILFTWLLGIVFTYTPRGQQVDFFLLNDTIRYSETLWYHALEHFRWIVICWALVTKTNQQGIEVEYAYLFVNVGDFIDFILINNEVWFSIWVFDITYNVFSTAYLSAVILWKHRKSE